MAGSIMKLSSRTSADEKWVSWLAGEFDIDGYAAPPLPPDEFQRIWVGASGKAALAEGMAFVRWLKDEIDLGPATTVLDFATGWGRIYRMLMRDTQHIVGADTDETCLSLCRQAMPWGDFIHLPLEPPYDLPTFDVACAYSLFTHLAEYLHHRILRALADTIKPGGFLAFTVLPAVRVDLWPAGASERYAKGEFLYLPTGGGTTEMSAERYGWAIFNHDYLVGSLGSAGFDLITRKTGPAQDFVLARRSSDCRNTCVVEI
jgi:SAM-dependent methyltransferase